MSGWNKPLRQPAIYSRQIVDCRLWIVDCGLWIKVFIINSFFHQ